MIAGLVDTTVFVHALRKNQQAIDWLKTQSSLGITPITWMEVIRGAHGKQGQAEALHLMKYFAMVYLEHEDQRRAMTQLLTYRLSHGADINDCLIAAAAHRLGVPLYTHNVKDMAVILDPDFVVKPYPSP